MNSPPPAPPASSRRLRRPCGRASPACLHSRQRPLPRPLAPSPWRGAAQLLRNLPRHLPCSPTGCAPWAGDAGQDLSISNFIRARLRFRLGGDRPHRSSTPSRAVDPTACAFSAGSPEATPRPAAPQLLERAKAGIPFQGDSINDRAIPAPALHLHHPAHLRLRSLPRLARGQPPPHPPRPPGTTRRPRRSWSSATPSTPATGGRATPKADEAAQEAFKKASRRR